MCRARYEGGQRCSHHGEKAVQRHQEKYDANPSLQNLEQLLDHWGHYASTPRGKAAAEANLAAGADSPGGGPSDYWARILQRGADLKERNAMLAAVEANKPYHEWRRQCPDLPSGIRTEAGLEQYLAHAHSRVISETNFLTSEIAEANDVLRQEETRLRAAALDPDATFESGLPRTEEDREAWLEMLSKERELWAQAEARAGQEVAKSRRVLAAFNRPVEAASVEGRLQPTVATETGFVGYVTGEDGTTDSTPVRVCGVYDDGTLEVLHLREIPVGSGGKRYGYVSPRVAQREYSPVTSRVSASQLTIASPETWAAHDGNFVTRESSVYATARGTRAINDYDDRRSWAW